jgi:hypothetical protein
MLKKIGSVGLRHCATGRKETVSIPDGVIGVFHWRNPSGYTTAMTLTEILTEMGTKNKDGRSVRLTTYLLYVLIVLKYGNF